MVNGWGGGWTRPVVKSLYMRKIYTKRQELRLKGQVLFKKKKKNRALTARTELRNCLFAPVGEKKNATALLFPFRGQTLLARLLCSR